MQIESLASYQRCVRRLKENWPAFQVKRMERLMQQARFGVAAEKVAENILEDLFTGPLDWSLSDFNNQIGYADIVMTRMGIKYLIIEVKRPGSLAWNRRAVRAALDQALRYADEQKVRTIAVSDGIMLYAADVEHGGLCDRAFVSLEAREAPECLWWLSVLGIYRPREVEEESRLRLLPEVAPGEVARVEDATDMRLHPKYHLPACCFAYIGHATDTRTWKLPYRLADGSIDVKRLPKAIQAILSNYRGAKVSGIDEKAIPDILVRLAQAANSLGKMPYQAGQTSEAYEQLAVALEQLGRLEEAKAEHQGKMGSAADGEGGR